MNQHSRSDKISVRRPWYFHTSHANVTARSDAVFFSLSNRMKCTILVNRSMTTVTNLARQAPKRRGRGRRHPCSPMARPHHSCRGHGHPSCLVRLGRSPTYRAGSDTPRPLAGPDLFLCFFYVAYASFSSLPFPIDIAYASFLLSATSVVSR